MSEEYSIANTKQTDFDSGVDARADLGDPFESWSALSIRLFRMTLSWVESESPSSSDPALPARLFCMTLPLVGSPVLAPSIEAKLQYFGHLKSRLIGKDTDHAQDWKQMEKGAVENEMVR